MTPGKRGAWGWVAGVVAACGGSPSLPPPPSAEAPPAVSSAEPVASSEVGAPGPQPVVASAAPASSGHVAPSVTASAPTVAPLEAIFDPSLDADACVRGADGLVALPAGWPPVAGNVSLPPRVVMWSSRWGVSGIMRFRLHEVRNLEMNVAHILRVPAERKVETTIADLTERFSIAGFSFVRGTEKSSALRGGGWKVGLAPALHELGPQVVSMIRRGMSVSDIAPFHAAWLDAVRAHIPRGILTGQERRLTEIERTCVRGEWRLWVGLVLTRPQWNELRETLRREGLRATADFAEEVELRGPKPLVEGGLGVYAGFNQNLQLWEATICRGPCYDLLGDAIWKHEASALSPAPGGSPAP